MDITVGGEIVLDVELNEAIQVGGEFPYYDGSYKVTPKATEQKLATRDKTMRDDVTVKAIPFSSVANIAGGVTINIAFD